MTIRVRHYFPILAAVMLTGILLFQSYQIREILTAREIKYSTATLQSLAMRAQSYIGRNFSQDNLLAVRQSMADLYVANRETQAILIDDNGRVIAADRLGLEGTMIDKLPIAVDPAQVQKAKTTLQGHVAMNAQGTALTAYYPISLAREGAERFSRTGVLIINQDVNQLKAEVKSSVQTSVFQSLFVVLLLVGSVAFVMHHVLIRRLNDMLAVSQRYIRGHQDARNEDLRNDEIGELSRAFNRVADFVAEKQANLERSEAQLRELNASLEKRIEERTEALSRVIEQRSQAEELARASEQELASILNLAPDGIAVIDQRGTLRKFNLAAERMFGWSADEVIGNRVNMLMPEPHRTVHEQYLRNYQVTREAKVIGYEREVDAVKRDGEPFPVALSVSELKLGDETQYVGIIRDITDRKAAADAIAAAQQRLLESEKMAALGGLVAGVAHEINTPVGVGVTAVSHLREQIDAFRENYQSGGLKRSDLDNFLATGGQAAEIIMDNLVRASDLIRSFKEIAVDQTGDDVRTVKLDEYLARILTSLQPRLKNRPITVVQTVEPDLRAELHVGGLSQVISNLVLNSLTHGFAQDARGEIKIDVRRRGRSVTIAYSDTGVGMQQDVVDRIFEPFFTTKRGQGGSGLGMHIVFNIVTQKFGGQIECSSVPGEGTQFRMLIPNCIVGNKNEETGS